MYNLKSLVTDRLGSFVRNKVPIKYFYKINTSQQEVASRYLFESKETYHHLEYTDNLNATGLKLSEILQFETKSVEEEKHQCGVSIRISIRPK